MGQEKLWVYPTGDFDETPELWVREGGCSRCGACCELECKLWYTTGCERGSLESRESDEVGSWVTGQPVAVEDWDGRKAWWQRKLNTEITEICFFYEGAGVCAIHEDKDRKEVCRKWPILPSDIEAFPQCTFSFSISTDTVANA